MALVQSKLVEYLYRRADTKGLPIGGVFELSPLCNMNCRMCYVRKSRQEVEEEGGLLTAGQWITLARQARNEGMLFLLLTGGEPFLRENFPWIYARLHEMGFMISVNTNGTLITRETMDWLGKIPPSRVNVTVYGASDETYERLCSNPGGYTQMRQGIALLRERGITVKLNCSITGQNEGDLEAILNFAKEEELPIEVTSYMFPPIRKAPAHIGENDRMSPEKTVEILTRTARIQGGESHLQRQWEKFRLQEKVPAEGVSAQKGNPMKCRAGISSFWITWDGHMLPCGMMAEPKYEPLQTGFEKSWREMKEAVRQIRLPLECSQCVQEKNCHTCAAMIYAETGSYTKVPAYRCSMMKHYKEQCRKYLGQGEAHEEEKDHLRSVAGAAAVWGNPV